MSRGLTALSLFAAFALLLTGCPNKPSQSRGVSYVDLVKEKLTLPDPIDRARELTKLMHAQATDGGDSFGAEETMKFAVKACGEIDDPVRKVEAYCFLAEGQAAIKHSSDAKKSLKEALTFVEKVEGVPGKTRLYARIGRTQGRAGDIDGAAESIATAEEMTAQLEGPYEKILALTDLAGSYTVIEKSEDVKRVVGTALKMAGALEDQRKQCEAIAKVAAKLQEMKNPEEARKAFDLAKATAEKIEDPHSRCYAMIDIAKKLHEAGYPAEARDLLNQAELLSNKISRPDFKQQTLVEIRTTIDKLNLSAGN